MAEVAAFHHRFIEHCYKDCLQDVQRCLCFIPAVAGLQKGSFGWICPQTYSQVPQLLRVECVSVEAAGAQFNVSVPLVHSYAIYEFTRMWLLLKQLDATATVAINIFHLEWRSHIAFVTFEREACVMSQNTVSDATTEKKAAEKKAAEKKAAAAGKHAQKKRKRENKDEKDEETCNVVTGVIGDRMIGLRFFFYLDAWIVWVRRSSRAL